jgi:ubiquinone/menaquinone biosynthesis C-methylase UbiE
VRPHDGLGARIHAWVLANLGHRYERMVTERKRRLLVHLGDAVLEIGPGTGPNLAYYPPGIHWLGVEPNPHMHPYLLRAVQRAGVDADLRAATAEQLPAADNSIDTVVGTLVLCSVSDPVRVLREVHRVLKPGGRFLFLEHVAAPPDTFLRRVQTFICPLWKIIGDGCHPDRDTGPAIEHAGFSEVTYEAFRLPLGPVAPQIIGVAIK